VASHEPSDALVEGRKLDNGQDHSSEGGVNLPRREVYIGQQVHVFVFSESSQLPVPAAGTTIFVHVSARLRCVWAVIWAAGRSAGGGGGARCTCRHRPLVVACAVHGRDGVFRVGTFCLHHLRRDRVKIDANYLQAGGWDSTDHDEGWQVVLQRKETE